MNKLKKTKGSTNESMDYLSENLLILLKTHQINESELAKNLSMPYNTVHRLLTGTTSDPRVSTLQQIADYFGVGLDCLLQKNFSNHFQEQKENLFVPIVSWESVINPDFMAEKETGDKTIQITKIENIENTAKLFALESTKSMQPRFPTGTTFIINKVEQVIDGDLILIRFKDNNAISLRELIIDSPCWQLNAVIPSSAPLTFKHEDHEIIGVVILTLIQTRNHN